MAWLGNKLVSNEYLSSNEIMEECVRIPAHGTCSTGLEPWQYTGFMVGMFAW